MSYTIFNLQRYADCAYAHRMNVVVCLTDIQVTYLKDKGYLDTDQVTYQENYMIKSKKTCILDKDIADFINSATEASNFVTSLDWSMN